MECEASAETIFHDRGIPAKPGPDRRGSDPLAKGHGAWALPSQVRSDNGRGAGPLSRNSAWTSRCSNPAAAGWRGVSVLRKNTTDISVACGERVLIPAVRDAGRRHADRHGRLQLPRTNRTVDRKRGASHGRGSKYGNRGKQRAGTGGRQAGGSGRHWKALAAGAFAVLAAGVLFSRALHNKNTRGNHG